MPGVKRSNILLTLVSCCFSFQWKKPRYAQLTHKQKETTKKTKISNTFSVNDTTGSSKFWLFLKFTIGG